MSALSKVSEKKEIKNIEYISGNIIGINFFQDDALTDTANSDNVIKNKKKKSSPSGRSNLTNAIKSEDDLRMAMDFFLTCDYRYKSNCLNLRNYALFIVACNCARRISDILKLKVCDFLNPDGSFKKVYRIQEKKTSKFANIYITDPIKEAITLYLEKRFETSLSDTGLTFEQLGEPLFISREKNKESLTRQQAWNIMNTMGESIGLSDKGVNVGCHSCRKTFAYQTIKNNKDNAYMLGVVQKALNHSSQDITLTYADFVEEDQAELYNSYGSFWNGLKDKREV